MLSKAGRALEEEGIMFSGSNAAVPGGGLKGVGGGVGVDDGGGEERGQKGTARAWARDAAEVAGGRRRPFGWGVCSRGRTIAQA